MSKESAWYEGRPIEVSEVLPGEDARHARLHKNARYLLPLSLLLGAVYALCFVQADYIGLNGTVFALTLCTATRLALRKIDLEDRRRDLFWTCVIGLLGLTLVWTANEDTQSVSILGIVLSEMLWIMSASRDVLSLSFEQAIAGGFRLFGRTFSHLAEPFVHLFALRKGKKGSGRYVLLGLCIAFPLAWLVLALLMSADAAFSELVKSTFGSAGLPDALRTAVKAVLWTLVIAVFFYAALCAQCDRGEGEEKPVRRAKSLVAVTFTAVLAVIYAVFCAVQITVLFAGNVSVLPEGMTYAEYAREGFFQLLFVSGINVVLILFVPRRFRMSGALRWILVFLSACTYLMEVSSAMRMMLYVNAYGLTYLRLLVLWFLLLLAVVLAGAVYTLFREKFRLFRFTFLVCLSLWLVFAFARPDRIAAAYDLKYSENRAGAINYVWDSSFDAVPALEPYFSEINEDNLDSFLTNAVPRRMEYGGVRCFNFSAWQAARTAEEYVNGK